MTESAEGESPLVLVVDDDDAIRRLLEALLGSAGYRVRAAADGQAGLEAIGEARPALVLLDLTLPKLDGWQVLDRLHADGDATPVVLLTGHRHLAQRAHRAGATAALLKPFDVDELLDLVERLVAGRG